LRRLSLGACIAALLTATAMGAAPTRIVSTAPSITEMLYALGLGDRVVGVTQYCRYPPEALTKPKVGTFLEPDFERILALRPDLVLVIKNPVQIAQRLNQLGVRAEELNQDSIEDVYRSLERIGELTGKREQAVRMVNNLKQELAEVSKSVAGKPRRTALFLVGRSPGTLQGMVGAASGTFIDQLMTVAGGTNVLKASPIQYPRVSLEQVLSSDPQVILDMGDFAHAEGRPSEEEAQLLALWAKYPNLTAVRTHQVRQVPTDVFVHPGPRMGEAARQIRDLLYGGGTAK
jgi:iron complex transport system substrate-binding protein